MRIGFLLTALVFFLVACAAPPLPEQAPPSVSPLRLAAGERIGLDRVILMTDASGTMYSRKTFPEAKAITRGLVAGMPDGSFEAGLVSFGGTGRITAPVQGFDRAGLAATAAELRILGDIDGRGGHTPFHRVFQEISAEVAGRGGQGAVVIVSDGLADRPGWSLETAADLAAAHGGQLCFHTVQTGEDGAGGEHLQNLAATTDCGSYRSAASLRDPAALMAFERELFLVSGTPTTPGRPAALPTDACGDLVRLRGIEFDFDESAIRSDAAPVLEVAVDRLRACPNLRMRIEGHTDWTGGEAYNQGLSERRAEAVRRHLTARGVDGSRLRTRGFGETDPIASNQSREGRARNRRVELQPE